MMDRRTRNNTLFTVRHLIFINSFSLQSILAYCKHRWTNVLPLRHSRSLATDILTRYLGIPRLLLNTLLRHSTAVTDILTRYWDSPRLLLNTLLRHLTAITDILTRYWDSPRLLLNKLLRHHMAITDILTRYWDSPRLLLNTLLKTSHGCYGHF
jgi:hypothetical protein